MKSTRRKFITTTVYSTVSAAILSQFPAGKLFAGGLSLADSRKDIELYIRILKEWCDALIDLQYKEKDQPGIYGGFSCPACGFIHGRCADAAFPLLYMADHTKDQKYLDAALLVYNWAERNVSMPDGSWINDIQNPWKGTTVFGTIALGEALKHHAHLLDPKTHELWLERFKKACDFLYGFITVDTSNINYPLSSTYAFALGGKLLDEPKFTRKGKEFSHLLYKYLTPQDQFIYGELKPRTQCPLGYWPVDLSYNVEETLPNLTMYAFEMQDDELLKTLIQSWKTHIEFMLPDGGWDDTFGTRNHKWTYWGSRNSDGCQAGLALLYKEDPVFTEAAYRNGLLLEKCTHKGLLYGGPHYVSHDVPPCVHHTFAHAKSLATILNHKSIRQSPFTRTQLPREKINGLKNFGDVGTRLISVGKWRGTVTANDCEYKNSPHASGGSLSILYHTDLGLLLTDSLFPELRLREASNQQVNSDSLQLLLTPRLEMTVDDKVYRSSRDLAAKVSSGEINGGIQVSVRCNLVSLDSVDPSGGVASFQLEYLFKKEGIEIIATPINIPEYDSLAFFLPVVSKNNEQVSSSENKLTVHKGNGNLQVTSTGKLSILAGDKDRVFSHSPGVEAIPLKIEWNTREQKELHINISAS